MKIFLICIMAFSLYASDGKKEHHLSKDLSYLDLSSQQKEHAKGIIKEYRSALKAFHEFKENMEKQKESLIMKETLKEEDLQRIHQALNDKANTIENRFLLQMHRLLTPEQRKKFAHNLEEWEVE